MDVPGSESELRYLGQDFLPKELQPKSQISLRVRVHPLAHGGASVLLAWQVPLPLNLGVVLLISKIRLERMSTIKYGAIVEKTR